MDSAGFASGDTDSVFKFAIKTYRDNFPDDDPSIAAFAPGRVNLIGEHTDYNDGFVLPMALPLITVAVGSKAEGNKCQIITTSDHTEGPNKIIFDLSSIEKALTPGKPAWANYVKGILSHFADRLCPFKVVIASSVPLGGGLSSSAALEVCMFTFLEAVTGGSLPIRIEEKARACQKAEHEFCGMPCGIMDQFISFLGKQDHALLLDCRSLEYKYVPVLDEEISILIINTNVRHQLSGSEYPVRRKQCEEACKVLGKPSLRDATMSDLEAHKQEMSDIVYRRAKHVITEIERTMESAKALTENDYQKFGKLMIQSHTSLKNDYEVSCKELDQVVIATLECDGVYGSRMTGGGFGGCTVTLLKSSAVATVINHVKEKYQGRPDFYECRPAKGAGVITLL